MKEARRSFKAGLVVSGPDVRFGPLALLSGTFEEKVRKASALGYDGIELMVRDPAQLDWTAIRKTVQAAQLEVPQIVTGELFGADGLCLVTPDTDLARRAFERTQSVIDLAAYLGAYVNIGRLRGRLDWLEPASRAALPGSASGAWNIAVERIRGVAQYAAKRGVRITLEPINRYETDFILTVADGLQMIQDLGCDNVGLMLDVFHMNIEEPVIEESFRLAGDRVWHVHIADSNRLYPGAGHLDLAGVFAVLGDMGYLGYVSAELFPRPDPDTAARKVIEFLRPYLSG